MYSKYKYKFYLDTNHAIYINNKLGQMHPHTWEITLCVKDFNTGFTKFEDIEKIIKPTLNIYQNKIMNDIKPFDKINPTIENVCKYFYSIFEKELFKRNIKLESIEFCESPKCSFIIDNSSSIQGENLYLMSNVNNVKNNNSNPINKPDIIKKSNNSENGSTINNTNNKNTKNEDIINNVLSEILNKKR